MAKSTRPTQKTWPAELTLGDDMWCGVAERMGGERVGGERMGGERMGGERVPAREQQLAVEPRLEGPGLATGGPRALPQPPASGRTGV